MGQIITKGIIIIHLQTNNRVDDDKTDNDGVTDVAKDVDNINDDDNGSDTECGKNNAKT